MTSDNTKLVEPYFDLGSLLFINKNSVEDLKNAEDLRIFTQKSTQYLLSKIWDLPRKIVQDATCVTLPGVDYLLPREKSIPKPRQPTKWEKFAKSKGIKGKKKRSKKIWDEDSKEWKPRFGYRRADKK